MELVTETVPTRTPDAVKTVRRTRTVNDFETAEELRMALTNMCIQSRSDCEGLLDSAAVLSEISPGVLDTRGFDEVEDARLDESWDWTPTNLDRENSYQPTVSHEVQRLQNVKSFQMIERDEDTPTDALVRLSQMGQRLFKVPICTISLMDIGRSWILCGQGAGNIRETDRKHAWCNHTVHYKSDLMVVPDATLDRRFCDNPHVTGPFHLRFYAGASIVSKEGFRIGELCVMGNQARPEGLSEEERTTLVDLAALVSQALAERRELNRMKQYIDSVANDLTAPVTSLSHCLASMKRQPSPTQGKNVSSADSRLDDLPVASVAAEIMRDTVATIDVSPRDVPFLTASARTATAESEVSQQCLLNMKDFIQVLHRMVNYLPKKVPVMIYMDTEVPRTIRANKIHLLRGAFRLLSNACERCVEGQIHFQIIRDGNPYGQKEKVTFECYDSRSSRPAEAERRTEEQHLNLLLSSLHTVSSHGIDIRHNKNDWDEDRSMVMSNLHVNSFSATNQATCAWFSIPLVETSDLQLQSGILTDIIARGVKESREERDSPSARPGENSRKTLMKMDASSTDESVTQQKQKQEGPSQSGVERRRHREEMTGGDTGTSSQVSDEGESKRIKLAVSSLQRKE